MFAVKLVQQQHVSMTALACVVLLGPVAAAAALTAIQDDLPRPATTRVLVATANLTLLACAQLSPTRAACRHALICESCGSSVCLAVGCLLPCHAGTPSTTQTTPSTTRLMAGSAASKSLLSTGVGVSQLHLRPVYGAGFAAQCACRF